MDVVVPLVLYVRVSASCVKSRESAEASGVCLCHPVQMLRFYPPPVSVSALSGVTDPGHQLVLGCPDLIYPQRGACSWADSPLWR